MNAFHKEVERAKKQILKGIWKKKTTPYAKVCGITPAHAQAMAELHIDKIIETYSATIVISESERNLEYYRWAPFTKVKDGIQIKLLAVRKLK